MGGARPCRGADGGAMNTEVMFSSASCEWATPPEFFKALDAEFHFTLDVCATVENAKCRNYFTAEQDGLAQSWGGGMLVQPSIWAADRSLGAKGSRERRDRCYAAPGPDGHGLVPRLHLRQSRDPLYQGPPEIRRQQEQRTVSLYGVRFQKGAIA